MLQQEEEKALKKIDETRRRAKQMVEMKAINEKKQKIRNEQAQKLEK